MKILSVSALIFLMTVLFYPQVESAVALIPYDPKTAKGGHCYTDYNNLGSMRKGEVRNISNQCTQARCTDDRNIQLTSCGTVAVQPPCKVEKGDLKKPYPECCPRASCP